MTIEPSNLPRPAAALRELFELDPQAVDAVAGGELPLLASDNDTL